MAKISKTDFIFRPCGYGVFNVTYVSPVTRKEWTAVLATNCGYLDNVYQIDEPKAKDLNALKWRLKNKELFG